MWNVLLKMFQERTEDEEFLQEVNHLIEGKNTRTTSLFLFYMKNLPIILGTIFCISFPSLLFANTMNSLSIDSLRNNIDAINADLSGGTMTLYATTKLPTPVYSVPDFPRYYG